MPIKPVKRFTAWSYTRLLDWEECPLKAKLKHLDKLKEPESPAMARGSAIHKEAEAYATGQLAKLPESLKLFKEEFTAVRKLSKRLLVEQQWGIAEDWSSTDWFDSDALKRGLPKPWLRVVIDLGFKASAKLARMIDHKTGKIRDTHKDQLELYALAGFAQPEMKTVSEVSSELWYLDQGEIVEAKFKRKDAPDLQAKWRRRSLPMLADETFPACPGNGCRWCPFGKSKGGPCPHN